MIARQGFRTQKGALPLLGTVVGNDDKVIQQLVNDKVDGWKKALELLAHEEIPAQLALLVGRWIMTAKPNSLARSLPPTITIPPLKDFGEAVLTTMQRRLNLSLQGDARLLFQQPLREGGLGFCSPSETAPYAFLAGFASSCLAIRESNLNADDKGSVPVGGGWLLRKLESCLTRYIPPNSGWPDEEVFREASRNLSSTSVKWANASALNNYKRNWLDIIEPDVASTSRSTNSNRKNRLPAWKVVQTKALLCSGKRTP